MSVNVFSLLSKRYPPGEYALMREVRDKAGSHANRSADFVVVNLWPSRGLRVIGIELKSYRGDWLSELKNPAKAENIFQYCDHFYLLTTDDIIAKAEEIPANWGWLCIKGQRIKVMKEAPLLTPGQISRNFFTTCLKRACDKTDLIHKDSIAEKIQEAILEHERKNSKSVAYLQKQLEEKTNNILAFQEAAGIDLFHDYLSQRSRKFGETVKFIANNGNEKIREELVELCVAAKEITKRIEKTLTNFEILKPEQLHNDQTH